MADGVSVGRQGEFLCGWFKRNWVSPVLKLKKAGGVVSEPPVDLDFNVQVSGFSAFLAEIGALDLPDGFFVGVDFPEKSRSRTHA